jgi:peptidoglycan hydrolase CwlO-like protein
LSNQLATANTTINARDQTIVDLKGRLATATNDLNTTLAERNNLSTANAEWKTAHDHQTAELEGNTRANTPSDSKIR